MTCHLCGRVPESEGEGLAWGIAVEHGEVRHLCPVCAREHVRDIESQLSPDFW